MPAWLNEGVVFYMEFTYQNYDHSTKARCPSYKYHHHHHRYSSGPNGPFGWLTAVMTSPM